MFRQTFGLFLQMEFLIKINQLFGLLKFSRNEIRDCILTLAKTEISITEFRNFVQYSEKELNKMNYP